jgi:Sulfotransferase family
MTLPGFFIIGVPKAGTTALHSALASHPEIFMSPVKEPKFFLCEDERPMSQSGPGDAHSAREWVSRRADYEALFEGSQGLLCGESTPFYLYNFAAHDRMAELVPDAKLIIVLRDPIDRAHSNWLHLWSDGLETERDFVTACSAEVKRISDGWGPFWHYLHLGRYGEQLQHLLTRFPRRQIELIRYRDLVDTPRETLDRICRFLGVEEGVVSSLPTENTRGFVEESARSRTLGKVIRVGANVGALFPPEIWRYVSEPLVRELQRGAGPRPRIAPDDRRLLVGGFESDIYLLQRLTGLDFSDWLNDQSQGEFRVRAQVASTEPTAA